MSNITPVSQEKLDLILAVVSTFSQGAATSFLTAIQQAQAILANAEAKLVEIGNNMNAELERQMETFSGAMLATVTASGALKDIANSPGWAARVAALTESERARKLIEAQEAGNRG